MAFAERPAPDTTSGTAHDTPPEAPSPEEAARARFGRPVPTRAHVIVDGTATEILPKTDGLFTGVLPIALTEALEAPSGWAASDAEALGHALMRFLRGLGRGTGQDAGPMRLDPAWRVPPHPITAHPIAALTARCARAGCRSMQAAAAARVRPAPSPLSRAAPILSGPAHCRSRQHNFGHTPRRCRLPSPFRPCCGQFPVATPSHSSTSRRGWR